MRRVAVAAALLAAACAPERGALVDSLIGEAAEDPAAESPAEPAAAGSPEATAADAPDAVTDSPDATAAEGAEVPAAMADRAALPSAENVPHIYMALQEDTGGPTSVILAIDRSRDRTPSDEPAIRLTPEGGQCNPQQLRYYNFPPDRAERPAYGPDEAARGVTARELPDYMATAVTSGMLTAGLIEDPEQSQPQNVCTRKLLQRIIIDRSTGQG